MRPNETPDDRFSFRPLVVTTTAETRDVLDRLARLLVEGRLAACCQVGGPITSYYRWQGQVESAEEWVCHIKTAEHLLKSVFETIQREHPYEEPELIAVPIVRGSEGYLDWMQEQIRSPDR